MACPNSPHDSSTPSHLNPVAAATEVLDFTVLVVDVEVEVCKVVVVKVLEIPLDVEEIEVAFAVVLVVAATP